MHTLLPAEVAPAPFPGATQNPAKPAAQPRARVQALRQESDSRALVLLDEVGTGTDPAEGAALGAAILQALARGGQRGAALTLATTHHRCAPGPAPLAGASKAPADVQQLTWTDDCPGYSRARLAGLHALADQVGAARSSLTSLKYDDERFENASVEFDEVQLAPTYRLLWGMPGRSNALNIAARLGLEPSIVDAARARLGSGQVRCSGAWPRPGRPARHSAGRRACGCVAVVLDGWHWATMSWLASRVLLRARR